MEDFEKRMTKMEETVHGEMGLIKVIQKLDKTVSTLHDVVIELKVKDGMRSSILGAVAGTVASIVLEIIKHIK